MKRLMTSACALAFAVITAEAAFAADLPRPAYKSPVYVAPFSWSGFYVGINAGYGWGTADISNVLGSSSVKPNGAMVGGTLGYNLQTGNWVWGIEGDFDGSWMKATSTTGPVCAITGNCQIKNTWLATLRGRVGYAFDRWLPYFTGGAAFGNEQVSTFTSASQTQTQTGWVLGGGVEYAFMGSWSTKIEYLHADLGSWTCGPNTTCPLATSVDFKADIVRLGLNYRF